ncbi:MAG: bifunctional ornithine acetyltransferase/N-acetylglutamate synthase [Rickettsiales bacterium]|nr:bifunctional ornithine acetyltransferase/N-acetylglutamate synthase [Rickettsiales bacterium]
MINKKNKIKFFSKENKIGGLTIKTFKVGIKSKSREDLSLIIFEKLASISSVLTKSKTSAANIEWLKSIKKYGKIKVLLAHSGNANAFTGREGYENIKKIIKLIAEKYNCKRKEIVVSSTGVIGEQLPIKKILNTISKSDKKENLFQQNWKLFAKSIMTTDTFPKMYSKNIIINKKKIKIIGIAKGSGMIAPDMATMLAFIFTDADIPYSLLQTMTNNIVNNSFNSITVDGDMSTNDMFSIISTNEKKCDGFNFDSHELNKLKNNLERVAIELSKMIIIDGEGARKLIEINVYRANSNKDARLVAMSIANSPLVKTAIAGEDANWGRIIMAIGKSKAKIKKQNISLKIGNYNIVKNGEVINNYNEDKINIYLRNTEIKLYVNLGLGNYQSRVWTCDLTKKYIEINADYRS